VTTLPPLLYGTAWKEDETERLTRLAIESGFRGIDTANQRRHYFEAAVGAGIASSGVPREELFIQTKFTYRDGQDHRLPYDPKADLTTQVRQSFASSLEHLQVESLDSYVLHGPSRRRGFSAEDREVWRAMEEQHAAGKTRFLGASNVALDQIEELFEFAKVKPKFVQNRCFARTRWDAEVRGFCARNDIVYQGFSLLTANVSELRSARFREIVRRVGKTAAQIVFRFAIDAGMLPLTGTTDRAHMIEDLAATDFELSATDVHDIEFLGFLGS
jgi:diketogulonate reductase-like aldo/keto reductase